jgi:hypothetical protein
MDCLSTGASLLLPPLSGRLNILKSLLAQDTNLTRGQVILMYIYISIFIIIFFFFLETAFRCHSFKFK